MSLILAGSISLDSTFKEPEIHSQLGGPVRKPFCCTDSPKLHRGIDSSESIPGLHKRLQIRAQNSKDSFKRDFLTRLVGFWGHAWSVIGLNRGRGLFLYFSGAPMILYFKLCSWRGGKVGMGYVVSDRGDRGFFSIWTFRFCVKELFLFPVKKAQWNRRFYDK
jgi:hypothetical protein